MDVKTSELDSHVEDIIANADFIIEKFGSRTPGSEGERKAINYLQKQFSPIVDEMEQEKFSVTPKLFMGIATYCMVFDLFALVLYWFLPALSFIFALIGFLMFFLEGWNYFLVLDPLFPKITSQNLIATKKSKKEPKRRILLNAHVDVSFEMRWNLKNHTFYRVIVVFGLLFVVITLIFSTLNMVFNFVGSEGFNSVRLILGVILLGLSPITIFAFLFYNYRIASPGANDDLSSCLLILELAKFLQRKGFEAESTEIVFLITGSEEAGTRGSKFYIENHETQLSEIETIFITFEVLADPERITILTTDHNSMIKLDSRVVDLLNRAANNTGIKVRNLPFPPGAGSTDAARFQKGGFPSGSILAVDHQLPTWYHTRNDTVDKLSPECLKSTLTIALETILMFDKYGLDRN